MKMQEAMMLFKQIEDMVVVQMRTRDIWFYEIVG